MLDPRIPSGPIEKKWEQCRFEMKLVNPANRRKHSIIIVGAGLAGAAAAATLGQQGYEVHCFSLHDTPAPGSFDCSARRHQCRKELSQ